MSQVITIVAGSLSVPSHEEIYLVLSGTTIWGTRNESVMSIVMAEAEPRTPRGNTQASPNGDRTTGELDHEGRCQQVIFFIIDSLSYTYCELLLTTDIKLRMEALPVQDATHYVFITHPRYSSTINVDILSDELLSKQTKCFDCTLFILGDFLKEGEFTCKLYNKPFKPTGEFF